MTTNKSNKNLSVTIRIDEETWNLLSEINRKDRRSGVSDVARLLLLRGRDLYLTDGKLFEDVSQPV